MPLSFENIVWMILLSGLAALAGMILLPKHKYRPAFVLIVEFALLCRFVLVFFMYKDGTEAAGTDGLIYHEVAKGVANQLKGGVPIWAAEYKYTWYTVLVGVQYALFGVNRYAASFMNAFISVLSVYFLFKISTGLKFSFKKSAVISLAYLFMPSMAVWTTDSRKEAITFFISILVWYLTLRVLTDRRPIPRLVPVIIAICLMLWFSTLLRIYMLYTLGGGILIGLIVHFIKTKRKISLVFGVMVLVTCVVVTYTTVLENMVGYHALPLDRSKGGDEDIIDEFDSIFKIIMSKDVPDAINGFLTKPHLRKVNSISDISGNAFAVTAVKIEMILWYLCLVVALLGAIDALLKWNPYLLGLLAFIVSYSLINALICENVGETYYRYRAAIVAPILLFADHRPLLASLRSFLKGRNSLPE